MGVTPKELKAMEANSREITKINNRLKRLQNSVMSRVNKPKQPEETAQQEETPLLQQEQEPEAVGIKVDVIQG